MNSGRRGTLRALGGLAATWVALSFWLGRRRAQLRR